MLTSSVHALHSLGTGQVGNVKQSNGISVKLAPPFTLPIVSWPRLAMVFLFNFSFVLTLCFFIFFSFNLNLTGLSTGRHIKGNTGAKTVLFSRKSLLISVLGYSPKLHR